MVFWKAWVVKVDIDKIEKSYFLKKKYWTESKKSRKETPPQKKNHPDWQSQGVSSIFKDLRKKSLLDFFSKAYIFFVSGLKIKKNA